MMKKLYILLHIIILIVLSISVSAANISEEFTSTWTANSPGESYYYGMRVSFNETVVLDEFCFEYRTTGTDCFLLNQSSTGCSGGELNGKCVLRNVSRVGNCCPLNQFEVNIDTNYTLANGNDLGGADRTYKSPGGMPVDSGYILWYGSDYIQLPVGDFAWLFGSDANNIQNITFHLPIAAPAAETSAPTIVAPSPADNANNNTNVTLNVSHGTENNDVR